MVIAFHSPDISGELHMRSCEFLKILKSDAITPDGRYTVDGTVRLEGDSGAIYDLKNATVEITATDAAVVLGENGLTLKNANIVAHAQTGVTVSAGGGAVIGCRIAGAETGIDVQAPDAVIKANTIENCSNGIVAHFECSERSAAMGKGFNILADRNTVHAGACALSFVGVSNGVAVLNRLDSAELIGCTNVYAIENEVNGTLKLCGNNYVIANGNSATHLVDESNENKNGDNITDIHERAERGANEKILPHINPEIFVGMPRRQRVRCADGEKEPYAYIMDSLSDGIAVIPPGAYSTDEWKFEGIDGLKIYAYGVLHELGGPRITGTSFQKCTNTVVKGLFYGHKMYPHTQGTVIAANEESLSFITDPGYGKDFSDGNFYGGGACGFYFKGDLMSPECDFRYESKRFDRETGINTLVKPTQHIEVGDRVAFRTGFGEGALHITECSEMLIEDVTVFSCSGFAESDVNCDIAPVLHRYAVVAGPAPLLDENERYEGFEHLIHRDSYGRLRSTEPMNTTCDATHCTNARTGIQMISCLLERMNDDGGNINAYYGLAVSYDKQSKTLEYTRCNVNSYRLLPKNFKVGDDVMMYTMSGKLVARVKTTGVTVDRGNDTFTVTLSEDVALPEGEQTVVQNASATGNGFLIDNVLVRDEGCNGFRLKAMGGEVRNCTFDRVSKGALDCVPEYQLWPECGYANNIRITKNIFRDLGRTARLSEVSEACAWCAAICIRYTLWDKGSNATSDIDSCLHRNIEISDNLFTNRYSRYEISMSAVSHVRIENNTFASVHPEIGVDNRQFPILLFGGNGVIFDNNVFSPEISNRIEYRYGKETTANISGSDVI